MRNSAGNDVAVSDEGRSVDEVLTALEFDVDIEDAADAAARQGCGHAHCEAVNVVIAAVSTLENVEDVQVRLVAVTYLRMALVQLARYADAAV